MNDTGAPVTGRVRLAGPARRLPARPAPRRWWRDVAGALAVLTLVAVTALWTANHGIGNRQGLGEPATTLGRLTGLWASDLLLLQVLLMARIPWVERAYGQDLLARRHRLAGFWSFWLMLAHVGLIGLALPHQLWTGADFTASAFSQVYWWTLYAVTLAAVLAFRVVLPFGRSAYHRLRVAQVVAEAPGVVSVYLRGRRLDRLPVRAGQFFLWRFLDGPGWTRAHPYTLSAGPAPDLLRITVKDLGDGSRRVRSLRPGTRVLIEGPYGALTPAKWTGRPPLLIAAGAGITTMRALLDEFGTADAVLLYRIRSQADAVFRAELNCLGARVVFLEGARPRHGSWLPAGYHPAALHRLVPDVRDREAYLCGPPPWMAAVRSDLRAAGMPDDLIHSEEFAW